jgi:hypothetical protein
MPQDCIVPRGCSQIVSGGGLAETFHGGPIYPMPILGAPITRDNHCYLCIIHNECIALYRVGN